MFYVRINVSGSLRKYFPLFLYIGGRGGACSVVSFVGRGARLWRHPVNVVSLLVSFRGRGARLWRHPG